MRYATTSLLIVSAAKLALADIKVGEQMTSSARCKSNCVDQGGVFCRSFGEDLTGYCCYSGSQIPCDQRMMQCSNAVNDVAKYYSCPFDTRYCGKQTLDVTDTIQEFEVYSNDFRNYTFCPYQFRKTNVNNKMINIKVIFAGDRLEFQAVQGDIVNKGYNLKKLEPAKVYIAKDNERIFLIAKSISLLPDSFKVQYYLTTPIEEDTSVIQPGTPTTINPNIYNGTTTDTAVNTISKPDNNSTTESNNTVNNSQDEDGMDTQTTGKSSGGTAIVAIIAVLIVLIPVGFGISCIIKKIRERRDKNSEEAMQLPDHSISNFTQQSPEQQNQFMYQNNHNPSNLNPFNYQHNDSDNMANIMNVINQMEQNQNGKNQNYDEDPIQFIEILSRQGEPMTIPIDQLPQFLQDMALNDPEIFSQLMADMDEEKLEEFIKEQDNQQFMNDQNNFPDQQNNGIMNSEMVLNQMEFVDPHFINEQQQAFNIHNGNKKTKKKRENNFINDFDDNNPQNFRKSEDNNLDMLVRGDEMDGGLGMGMAGPMDGMGDNDELFGNQQKPKKKSTKKKTKKKRNNIIEVIDDLNTPEVPVVLDPRE